MTTATMSAPAKVSVVVPTFNRSDLLAEAVASVLAKTQPVHEIVIIDDGSDEPHRRALAALAREDRIVHVHEVPNNQGRSRARNIGLEACTGNYVLFLDDDDLLGPTVIESALSCFAMDGATDIVVCQGLGMLVRGTSRVSGGLNPFLIEGPVSDPCWVSSWVGSARQLLNLDRTPILTLLGSVPPINACVIRREAIGETRFLEHLSCGEDWVFWMDLAVKRCRFRFSPRGRVYVRKHEGNAQPYDLDAVLSGYDHILARVRGAGREEEFLATALLARMCFRLGRSRWLRLIGELVRSPSFLLKYGYRFCTRRADRFWRRTVGAGRASTAGVDRRTARSRGTDGSLPASVIAGPGRAQ